MTTNSVLDRPLQTAKKPLLVVDDHPLMRQGLDLLINQQQDMQVCGEAEEAQAAMHAIAQLRPDIMILDISLNGPDGLDISLKYPHLQSRSARSHPLHAR